MPIKKYHFLIPILLGAVLLVGVVALWPAQPANAQCGSQASSCKNCHETQNQMPVNNDGTGWHQSHAFGDFCYICHAGNNQSMDKAAAHTGMVPPLADVKAACQSCHPNDLMERAQVYADKLGVKVGGGTAPAEPTSSSSQPPAAAAPPAAQPPAMTSGTGEVIDYNQRYAGTPEINWGNIILVVMIILVAAGGGTFVFWNEKRLRGKSLQPKPAAVKTAAALPQVEGYSPEIAALLPQIAQLNPVGLHALKRILENPEQANDLLYGLSRLDPELIRRIRTLDHNARAVLLALAGD